MTATPYLPTARSVSRQVETEDPWAYARRCAETLRHGQITINVECSRCRAKVALPVADAGAREGRKDGP